MIQTFGPPTEPQDPQTEWFKCDTCRSVFSDAEYDVSDGDTCPECDANGERGYLDLFEPEERDDR